MQEKSHLDLLWSQIRARMEEVIHPVTYETYIKSLIPVDIDEKKIILEAPSKVFPALYGTTIGEKMKEAVQKANVGVVDFAIRIQGTDDYIYTGDLDSFDETQPSSIDPKFTFESYVVGRDNQFVFAAAKSVANDPAGIYNPLFIYGGTGLGKTHLMQAIANEILIKKPSMKVLYTTCEKFTNELIDTLFSGRGNASRDKSNQFRTRYRNCDVLIIDDIQFLSGKQAVQEEFFHTFNELTSQNKQIILSSDCHPNDIATLEGRLRTRFAGGLIVDVVPPTLETKIAILKRKAYEKKCPLPDDVLEFLAQDSGEDVRTLEGRLTKVIFASKLHEEPITIELAKSALSDAVKENEGEQEEVNADVIINSVCSFFRISRGDLLGKSKKKELVYPRQICTYMMCELLTIPLVMIGEAMGRRDHTTVIYSRSKISDLAKVNDKVQKDISDIKNIIFKQ